MASWLMSPLVKEFHFECSSPHHLQISIAIDCATGNKNGKLNPLEWQREVRAPPTCVGQEILYINSCKLIYSVRTTQRKRE